MRSAPPVAPAPMPQPSGHSGQDLPTDSSGQPGRYVIVPASQETGQQDPEQPDRVPALPTIRPRDRMPPNMDSHGTEHLQQRFERQDIENGNTSRSPSPTRDARPTPGCTSEHWRVLEVPEGLWCTLHCKAKGCTTRRATWCIGPKPRSTTTAIAEIYPVVAKNCNSTDAAGRACKCFRGRNHRTSRRVHGDYAGLHDHCECRPAEHLALAVNARF